VRTFRLTLEYDGTRFHGWQLQPELRTVQGALEDALARLPIDQRSRVVGAGRTDAGVHARGQVASFSGHTTLPTRAIAALLGRWLPEDVRIRTTDEVDAGFHARHSARARRYAYRLLTRDDVLWGRFAWAPPRPAAPDALERAVRVLEGEHDFAAFQASGGAPVRSVCRVMRASWSAWEGGIRLDMIADHFLYHMVRNIVGTALAVTRLRDPAARMQAILAGRDRRAAGVTAPPTGLTLEQVFYAGEDSR
jgi:tRNA pseudouridine38-40 synthase